MPIPKQRHSADHGDVFELQKRLMESADKLSAMAGQVALAKQIREFESDRRRRALALATVPFLKAGDSHARAETEARATDEYRDAMIKLGAELQKAEAIIMDYEATKIKWESARSLLAMQRDMVKNL